MMLARDEATKTSSRTKDDAEQIGRIPKVNTSGDDNTSNGNSTRDGGRSGASASSQEKRKFEPESPVGMKPAAVAGGGTTSFVPEPKRERTSYYDLGEDVDSPSSYPKHVIVDRFSSSLGPVDDEPIPHPLQPTMLATHGSFSPPESKGVNYSGGHNSYTIGHHPGAQLLTPDSIGHRQQSQSYDSHHQPQYGSSSSRNSHHHSSSYHDVYRTASYNPEMDYSGSGSGRYGHASHGSNSSGQAMSTNDSFSRTRRWACDYCNVATFLSYEEACAHEETCPARHNSVVQYNDSSSTQQYSPHLDPRVRHRISSSSRLPPTSTTSPYGPTMTDPMAIVTQAPSQGGTGLGALYHASQEVVTPPTPHRHAQSNNRWGDGSTSHSSTPHGPPLPVLPHEQGYFRGGSSGGYYDRGDEPQMYPPGDHHGSGYHNPQSVSSHHQQSYQSLYHQAQPYHHPSGHDIYFSHSGTHPSSGKLVLAMPTDRDSLSDRQCYVRSEMVEIFAATEKDVTARHSKGAQKLVLGQVGIRCIHCRHLRPRDRAERAVCYPSSISRIYQTVADMQRFHFEQCREIPDHVRQIYKKLKTTRPRGVGSPQTYWISSAKNLGLADTGEGIRFENDPLPKAQNPIVKNAPSGTASSTASSKEKSGEMSVGTN